MSFVQLLRTLLARRMVVLVTLGASLLGAIVTAQLFPPRYVAKNRVLIDVSKPDAFGGAALSNQALNSYISTQLKMIKDAQTAGLVVDALGWATDPGNQAAFDAVGRPGGDIRDWLAQRIVAGTDATFVEVSSIVEISYRGTDPVSTQGIAREVREAFLKLNRNQRVAAAQRSAASFDAQAKRALAELQRLETERIGYARANDIVTQPGAVDLENAKLGALSGASTASTASTSILRPTISSAIPQLRQQIAQAELTLGPNHPTYQALRRQLTALETSEGLSRSVVHGSTRAEIEASYQRQKAKVFAQADEMDRLQQMETDIAILRDQYQKLSSKAEQMKAVALAGVTPMEPLGDTNLPQAPEWPNKLLITGGSTLLGLALGVLFALLIELLARRVRGPEDLEAATGAPVLAVISKRKEWALIAGFKRLLKRSGTGSSAPYESAAVHQS